MKKIGSALILLTLFSVGCGRQQTDNMDPVTVPLQRNSTPSNLASQEVPSDVSQDWNQPGQNATTSAILAGNSNPDGADWKKQIKDASDKAINDHSDKVIPDRSYRSIWVHLFPVFATKKAYAIWPKRMPAPDPYAESKDLGSIKLDSPYGFKVARLHDGTVIKSGQVLSFSLEKNQFILDGKSYPLEDLYIDADSTNITKVSWDYNKIPYKYRGSFVITKELAPNGTYCLRLVNVVDFEAYLMDVVPGEMPASYADEALKVQAIAARTYALNKMLSSRCDYQRKTKECRKSKPAPFDVYANTQDQLYVGVAKENSRTNSAVASTAGEVVVHDGQVTLAMFHANSGGRTCSYADCYGETSFPYLETQLEQDKEALRKISGGTNHTVVNAAAFAAAIRAQGLKFSDSQVVSIQVTQRNLSERVEEVIAKGPLSSVTISQKIFNDLRTHFGVPTDFVDGGALNAKHELVITSYGWGHGVGISQEGARLQAQRSVSYKDIIGFYYTKCSVLDLRKTIPGSI